MDWYVLLTPVLLIPIVSLLVFVGCELEKTGALASNEPGPLQGIWADIDIPGTSLKGYVDSVDLWCEKADGTTSAHAKAPILDQEKQGVQLLLTGAFLGPPLECLCAGTVTKIDGTQWLINKSAPKKYTIDPPGPFFWLAVTKDNTGAPIKFSLMA